MISELLKKSLPSYEVILPISKKKVKIRPMTVKEEKILLIAQSTKSSTEAARAIIQVVENCADIKAPEKLPIADVEKLFLEIRAKSIGENLSFVIKDDDQRKVQISVNIEDFAVEGEISEKHSIAINDTMVLILKTPDFSSLSEVPYETDDILKTVFKNSFFELQTTDNTYGILDVQQDDLDNFYDYMTPEQLKEFQKFVDKIPRLKKTIEYDDSNGNKKTMTLMGIDCFFAYASAT